MVDVDDTVGRMRHLVSIMSISDLQNLKLRSYVTSDILMLSMTYGDVTIEFPSFIANMLIDAIGMQHSMGNAVYIEALLEKEELSNSLPMSETDSNNLAS